MSSLRVEEEQQFLAPFFVRARRGEIATATEVKLAFEARVGNAVQASTVYRLLDRHGWRKLMPRPHHPKGSTEEQEHFKKTLRRRFRRQSQHGKPMMSDPL